MFRTQTRINTTLNKGDYYARSFALNMKIQFLPNYFLSIDQ